MGLKRREKKVVILKNGTLIEPSTGFMGKMDVAVKGEEKTFAYIRKEILHK